MKFVLLLLLLLAITASSSPQIKKRYCGRALHLLIKKTCGPTPCEMVGDIATEACSEGATAEWIKEKCCP
ncbi:unnamed protein product [Caenorhabditis brenneri]